jgi:AraC family transcriptional regulator
MSHVDITLARSTLAPRRPGQPQTHERIEHLLSKATSAIECDVPEARALLAEAVSLLRDARGRVAEDEAANVVQRGGLAAWQARRAASHIDLHLDRTIPVAELAALVRLSRTHFSAAFHGSFGRPPHTYVLERRVARAKQLMLETDLPLSQIACECGLCDQAHLSRLFRRFVGESPLLWRRAHLEPGGRAARSLSGQAMRLDA